MVRRVAWMCGMALAVSACGPDDTDKKGGKDAPDDMCEASAKHAALEIGTSFVDGMSVTEFVPVGEGEAMTLVHGAQGGFHVEVALRGQHLDASEVIPGEIRGWVNGEMLANVAPWFLFNCTDGGQDSWGTLLIFRAQPEDLHQQDVDIEIDLTDVSGAEVTAAATFRIVDPALE